MVVFRRDHDRRDVQTADFLLTLHTLGRLVQEATSRGPPPSHATAAAQAKGAGGD